LTKLAVLSVGLSMIESGGTNPTKSIDSHRHRIEMGGVNASAVSAKMVKSYYWTGGKLAVKKFIG
jgi:hypothetical protein